MSRTSLAVLLTLTLCTLSNATAADWPTWLGDSARTGCSEEQLEAKLSIAWAHMTNHPPSPAVAIPHGVAKKDPLGAVLTSSATNDYSPQIVVAGGKLYFGSSSEQFVRCLDAKTGATLWTFYAEGAVRFAPVCHEGRVYFGSDDGFVYCLDGATGKVLWEFEAAIGKRRIIANGRIASQWPVRTGLTIRDGIVYAACGIFPSEDRGVMLYGLNAETGMPAWKSRLTDHAMGHIFATEKSLLIPAGRSIPQTVPRVDGVDSQKGLGGRRGNGGSSPFTVAGMRVYGPNENGGMSVYLGTSLTRVMGYRMLANDALIYQLRQGRLIAMDRLACMKALQASTKMFGTKAEQAQRKKTIKDAGLKQGYIAIGGTHHMGRGDVLLAADMKACTKWSVLVNPDTVAMIRSGDQIIIGGKGGVQAFNATDGKPLWSAPVTGAVWDLAASDGAVFASTDAGEVICLRAGGKWTGYPAKTPGPLFGDAEQKPYETFVKSILAQADTKKGFCVVAGLTNGRLIAEIVKQTDMFVVGIEPNADVVAKVRATLSQPGSGPYGARVSIHTGGFDDLPYLGYFANIIVSESAYTTGKLPCEAAALLPMLQPNGGLLLMAGKMEAAAMTAWGKGLTGWQVNQKGIPVGTYVRPALEGAGEWTHMFANAANTLCSDDTRVGGTRYDIQWIGGPGSERQWGWHFNSMSNLYKDGRMYMIRRDHVMGIDAYNGTPLWELDVPGSLRLAVNHESGQACVDSDFMYVAATNDCWLIDVNTGRKTRSYVTLEPKTDWGYVAIAGDLLLGSCQSPKATYNAQNSPGPKYKKPKEGVPPVRTRTVWGHLGNTQVVSSSLFALAKADGAKAWHYARKSHILNSSITIGDGAVFFVECRNAALPDGGRGVIFLKDFFAKDAHMVALDLKTGAQKWSLPIKSHAEEVFYISYSKGNLLTVATANTPFAGQKEVKDKNYYNLRMRDAATGAERWKGSFVGGKKGYAHGVNIQPAVIMGDKIYLSMRTGGRLFAFDFATGKHTETPNFRGGKGCGVMTGSSTALFFRDYMSRTYDTVSAKQSWTSAINRPSCWLNNVPAGGLLMLPEATTGCDCTWAIMTSFVLVAQPPQ